MAAIKSWVDDYDAVVKAVEDLRLMPEFVEAGLTTEAEMDAQYAHTIDLIEKLELRNMLRSEEDKMGAIMDINAGAGGTEALDWASMLLRMYTRWCDAHGYKYRMMDYQAGDEVGVKSCTLEIEGEYAYGYLKSENGVHRMVRLSPFNANNKRQTTFASVFVSPAVSGTPTVRAARAARTSIRWRRRCVCATTARTPTRVNRLSSLSKTWRRARSL